VNTQFPLFPTQNSSEGIDALNDRVAIIGSFASPNAGGYVVGQYYDNSFHGAAPGVIAGAANRVEMSPFFVSESLTIDQLGVSVSTAAAGSLLKCFIYGSNSQGWPDQLLYEGNNDLSGASTGFVAHTLTFSFNPGIKTRKRNEALDCLVYAYAIAELIGLKRMNWDAYRKQVITNIKAHQNITTPEVHAEITPAKEPQKRKRKPRRNFFTS